MTEENPNKDPLPLDIAQEIADADARLAIDFSQREMPLEITIRSIALTVAQRHCGDKTVTEGNLYQQLKMDNRLSGPLTVNHVLHAALIFERYLWGEWSKGIAGDALTKTMNELDEALRASSGGDPVDEDTAPPTRPHSGGEA